VFSGLLVLALTGCQGTTGLAPYTQPLPSRLEGLSPFALPAFRWTPERETVHRSLCVSEQGTQESVTRMAGVKRHEHGLTEVRLELDGEEIGRAFYTDVGRLAHTTMNEALKKSTGDVNWEGLSALDALHQPLAQRRPISFTVPANPDNS
jgi:hypothetical protein